MTVSRETQSLTLAPLNIYNVQVNQGGRAIGHILRSSLSGPPQGWYFVTNDESVWLDGQTYHPTAAACFAALDIRSFERVIDAALDSGVIPRTAFDAVADDQAAVAALLEIPIMAAAAKCEAAYHASHRICTLGEVIDRADRR